MSKTSNEITQRYQKKTFEWFTLMARKVEDADIIELINAEKAKGFQTSEAIKNLIRRK